MSTYVGEEETYFLSNMLFEEKILQGRSNKTFFGGFVKTTLWYQIGSDRWYETMVKDPQSEEPLCTPSDEAFAILNVLNLRNYWLKKWSGEPVGDREKPLYTKKKGTTRDAQGWSQEGIQRFNQLMIHVKSDRASNPTFDKEYRVKTQKEMEGKKKRKRASERSDQNVTLPVTDEDLFDDFLGNAASI